MDDELRRGFVEPPIAARPWVRWWWFGNVVTREEIERELAFIARAGWGGVELQCVYAWPDALPGPDMLSEAWFDLVDYAIERAAAHGLGFDLTFGSGWPFGGPHIPPEAQALTLRAVTQLAHGPDRFRLDIPLAPGERVIAWRTAPVLREGNPPVIAWEQALDLESSAWDVPCGTWAVTVIIQTYTYQRVKRAAPGGEGFVHDHLSRRGLDAHLAAWGEGLRHHLSHRLGRKLRALFCDSWEVQGPYWTADFLGEFQRRRGYELRPFLPLLLGHWRLPAEAEWLADVRYDYRKTVAELTIERFYQPFTEWCRAHGLLARVQAHGAPTDWLRAYGMADFPETEAILIPLEATRLAASAARLYGRAQVTSESFTCPYGWPAVKMFAERPDDLKAIADGQFACGLQQVVYHGYAYSPPEVGTTPGWHFYASSHLNHTIPWREHLADFNAYLTRVSFLLQQGIAVTDLALYLPVHDRWRDATALGPSGAEADMFQWPDARDVPTPPVEIAGYTFDWVNDEALARMTVADGRLSLERQIYHAVVLDRVRYLPLATAERLAALVEAGVPLILLGEPPRHVPGYLENPSLSARLRELWDILLRRTDRPVYRSIKAYREAGGLPPDLEVTGQEERATRAIWWAHRRVAETDIYFIPHPKVTQLRYPLPYHDSHQRPQTPLTLELSFRITGRVPQLWDPETGSQYALSAQDDGMRTQVRLTFAPNQAHVVIFPPAGTPAPTEAYPMPGTRPLPIVGPWQITFPDGTVERWRKLRDWRHDPRLRDFAGTLIYRAKVDLPTAVLIGPIFLDLGLVEVIAEVWVNRTKAGVRLWSPYWVRVDSWLRPGDNEIEVRVTNLLYNAVQGQRERAGGALPIPGLQPHEWKRIQQQGLVDSPSERRPSGLLGPVQLWLQT
ncbi:MAG: glycosyl hydrolase [Anaerolineae bacterium]|nr:glycosyl hydrolase [Anaerolineae bacterium]